ncbi:hypothetical protein FQN57_000595 [Myotisia sp. PD_48]|nr:hypothetical protein FQN57_000595 [Myotisia sp. PD_48]
MPSTLIYHGQMAVSTLRNRYPETVRNFNNFLRQIIPSLDIDFSRILVHFPGSWVHTSGTSSFNMAHVRWALEQVAKVLKDENLKSINGEAATILVIPYYRAQLQVYETEFLKMVKGGVICDGDVKRVKFVTPDSSQGDEADFCIVDLVLTDHPGFTGDQLLQCVTLTRSQQAEIIIASPGMFVGRENDPSQLTRAAVLRRAYIMLEQQNAVTSINTCGICEIPNADHTASSCTVESDLSNVPCRICNPKYHAPHNQKTCPNIQCRRCKHLGHRTSECNVPLPCSRCHQTGHSIDQCVNRQCCQFCGKLGHFGYECEVACRNCFAQDHPTTECKMQVCANCRKQGHHISVCTTEALIICKRCSGTGHMARECHQPKVKTCKLCHSTGHIKRDCDQLTCDECGGSHAKKNCTVNGENWKRTKLTAPSTSHRRAPKADLIDKLLGKLG